MDLSEIYSILWSCLGVILTGLTSWGLTLLIKWLNSKIKDDKLKSYMNQLTTIISNAVLATEQTFVSSLKKDGAWDSTMAKEALNKALDTAQSQLSTDLSAWIKENHGDVTTYLTQLIEAQIGALKEGKAITTKESGQV